MKSTIAIVQQEVSPGVYKGKWGFYSCDYKTFLMLKKIRRYYCRAISQVHNWYRWDRKAPQNRVTVRWERNEKGQKCKKIITGPRLEPRTDPLFTNHLLFEEKLWHGDAAQTVTKEKVEMVEDRARFIQALYCCRPAPTPGMVIPLGVTSDEIRELCQQIDEQEARQ